MDTEKYQALVQAAEQGSITAAARSLGYSPSGLTRMLDSLEREVGFPLLARTSQGVRLTREGEGLLPSIRGLLYWSRQIREQCNGILGLDQGELFVGSYYSIASCWLPGILREFQKDYPGIRVHVQEAGNQTLLEGLREHQLSCCLFSRHPGYQGDWVPLYEDRLVAWVPEDHPLAQKRPSCRRTWKASLLSNPCPSRKQTRTCSWINTRSIRISGSPPATCTPAGPWWRRDWGCPWTTPSAAAGGTER